MLTNENITSLPYYTNHKSFGHWLYNGSGEPETCFGFTYIITNLLNHKKYIGCKQIVVKKKKDTWKNYTGSNKELNQDITTYGKQYFLFEITDLYYDRQSLRMGEAMAILGADALNRNDYYNQYLQIRLRVLPKNKVSYLPKLTKLVTN